MLAEIIAIGDELTSGQRLDTNSQWLSQQLSDIGVLTVCHQTIADYLTPMIQAFRQAATRSDLILVTGGLGPTADDLTRQALAEAFNSPLTFDQASWSHIEDLFKKRNYPIPESNRIQAMFPQGSCVIPNANGTAPGIDWSVDARRQISQEPNKTELFKVKNESRFFCLPGVPAEMKEMFVQTVLPRIQQWQGAQKVFIQRKVIKTFGAGESHIESMLPDLIRRGHDPQVGITASKATISLRIEAKGDSQSACEAKIDPVAKMIYDSLGDLVYGEGEDELEDAVVPMLAQSSHRLVVVEWGTAGAVSQSINRAAQKSPPTVGSRLDYAGSVILSNAESVSKWLAPDVSIDTSIDSKLSPQWLTPTVQALASVAADRFQASLAIAGGPLPFHPNLDTLPKTTDTTDFPRTPFFIAAVVRNPDSKKVFYSKQFHVLGHQSIWQPRASKQVLNHLRLLLLGKLEADLPSD